MSLIDGETFDDDNVASPESLSGKELYRCTFRNVKWPEARIDRCIFETCTFEDCDLTRIVLAGVHLRGVVFRRCKLLGVDFTKLADNPDVTFHACEGLQGAARDRRDDGASPRRVSGSLPRPQAQTLR